MDTQPYDWTQFSVRININAPLEKLYWAWSTGEGIEHWFLRLSEYKKPDGALHGNDEPVQKGDTYKWLCMAGRMIQWQMAKYWKLMEKIFFHSALVKQATEL